ncbi:uncharacterized protein LOC115687646 isoform X2 [Syzygium oleosum]|uniref:uncharacterized protein LOC115687646 isoform X2 n=1 Tax=Syzygium oleosum TaxID=219896 RepID=UPI0024BB8ED8|nr:uncharacterized protein LOC115687646 isoform X2 [Syzygium oleosum]
MRMLRTTPRVPTTRRETTTTRESARAISLILTVAGKILGAACGISIFQKVSEVNGVRAKMDALEMNMRILSARKDDVGDQLKQEERTPGKKRKKEVELWMQSIGLLEDQVRKLGRKVREGHFFSLIMLEGPVSDLATQVKDLRDMGGFDDGLTLDVIPDRGSELQLGEQSGTNESTPLLPDCLEQSSTSESTPLHDCLNRLPLLKLLGGLRSGGSELQLGEQSRTNESTPLPDCLDHLPLLELEGLRSGGSEPQLGEQSRTYQSTPLPDYLNLLPLWELELLQSLENLHLTPCRGLRCLEEPPELDLTFCSSLSTLPSITAAF